MYIKWPLDKFFFQYKHILNKNTLACILVFSSVLNLHFEVLSDTLYIRSIMQKPCKCIDRLLTLSFIPIATPFQSVSIIHNLGDFTLSKKIQELLN